MHTAMEWTAYCSDVLIGTACDAGRPRIVESVAGSSLSSRGGGKRVLFVCSTWACDTAAATAMAMLKREGVETKMISPGHIGHLVDDRVITLIRENWPWVVRDRSGALGPW
ncbi:hypothetical protein [Polyangium jinanense]|uniref:Uncharacterized protein n=1 Tax=Polyangium jinanense TaxID=2829994 RepID=A0A9X4AXE7_9BACT|nr:hypothetical protein [Polyangium jinanense]MDC3985901.1 hypothetical protein [Polyangium jinanense]MDC3988523.1 hypothetical protein [Polyangium jinanense]